MLFSYSILAPEPQSEEERKIYETIREALDESPGHLELLTNYSGCEEPIRKALNDPGPKSEQAAWKAVSKAVDKLYEFYKFSLTLGQKFLLVTYPVSHAEKGWPMTMDASCGDDAPASIQNNLALAKQIAQIFDFVFHFDDQKMINPAIQNDFSYYRSFLRLPPLSMLIPSSRVLSRMKHADKDKKSKVTVDEELANKMSFFFAYPTPMMKVIIDATTEFDKSARPRLIAGLSHLANLCLKAIERKDYGEDNVLLHMFVLSLILRPLPCSSCAE